MQAGSAPAGSGFDPALTPPVAGEDRGDGGRREGGIALAAAGVFFSALLLRLWAVEGKFLWFDEFLSANLARHRWTDLLAAVHREAHPPLYFALLKAWATAFGDGRVAMKMLSLVAGMAALVLLAEAARSAFGGRAALVATVLFTFATVQIDQATDAKPYALLAMFLAALLAALVRLARTPGTGGGWLAGAAAAAACCASTHFYGGLAAIAVSAAAVVAFRGGKRRRAAALLVVSALSFAVWLPAALRLPRGAADYIRDIWARVPGWAPLAVSLRVSLPGWRKPYPAMNGIILPDPTWREAAGAAVLAALFVAALRRRCAPVEETGRPEARRFLLISGLALLPGFLAAETILNFLDRPVGLPGRFEVVTQTGLALLAAASSFRLRRCGTFTGLLVAIGVWTTLPQWPPPRGPLPIRREEVIVRALEARLPPGGSALIVMLGLARPPFDYYAAGDPRLRLVSFPASQDDHPGWRVNGEAQVRSRELSEEADRLVAKIDEDLECGISVYLAAREDPRNEALLSRLRADHAIEKTPFADWFFELRREPVRLAGLQSSPVAPPPPNSPPPPL